MLYGHASRKLNANMAAAIKKSTFLSLLREGNFRELFISELGWNQYRGAARLPLIETDGEAYDINAIAERNGFQILTCTVETLPTQSVAKKIDAKLRRQANDYICIFRQRDTQHDLWAVPVRAGEKRNIVLAECDQGKADFLYSKIDGFSFALDEETTIVDIREKVQGAFAVNSEKITKDFYSGFKKEHKAFAEFITGIDDNVETRVNRNKQWYTSVMLNRLMFCYFIQKKGFLDLDFDYLRNKLGWVRREQGENRFFKSFYRGFLSRLFHDGLNSPVHDREFERIYGKIPYLNGGMFDEHQLEREYDGIDIADEAFMRLFDFFDTWRWHLDTRITASGRDINPDVLGYIFEQYINDRAQMGAYYTKEDITEYIGKNCILPFLIDRTAEKSPAAFAPGGYVWQTLRASGGRYIYDAVRKGYTPDWRDRIPEGIAAGLDTDTPGLLDRRKDWNTRTPAEFALPTEIWRETIERFKRVDGLLAKIAGGEITAINDFITLNLDIRSFVYDILANAQDHGLIRHFYHALQAVSILDPTCGSGAFLFAAMNILEPLYEVCIERMQEFNAANPLLFKAELTEIADKYRSNIQYFIFKSIILRNLYGVDIMVEATEIAKLRLFLKMVAVVDVDRRADNLGLDPLPDIDFNIRCGNTLVGYANEQQLDRDLSDNQGSIDVMLANGEFKAKIEEEMKVVSRVYEQFKRMQLQQEVDMTGFKEAKQNLRDRLAVLNDLLNQRQHQATGQQDYGKWLETHQPFNWLAEFYHIIHDNGGFDVIIGNPPYVVYTDNSLSYKIGNNYRTRSCANLYAFCVERSDSLKRENGRFGMIVPNSSISAQKMLPVQQIIKEHKKVWISNYSWRPSKLFEGADMLLAIIIFAPSSEASIFTTLYQKWYNEYRNNLFNAISYSDVSNILIDGSIPKIPRIFGKRILNKQKLASNGSYLSNSFVQTSKYCLYYFRAVQYWFKILTVEPIYDEDGVHKATGEMKPIYASSEAEKSLLISILSSSTFFLNYIIWSSCQVVNSRDFNMAFNRTALSESMAKELSDLGVKLQEDYQKNSHIVERNYSKKGRKFTMRKQHFYIKYSKAIIDEIDKVLAKHYGFTEEELDFIINYDIKYRMGDELNADK